LYFANNSRLLSISNGENINFRELAFEYTGTSIYGAANTAPIRNIIIEDCTFYNTNTGISFISYTVDGVLHENDNIQIKRNSFDVTRFAVKTQARDIDNTATPPLKNNTATRHLNLAIMDNTITNVSIAGQFALNDSSQDIEAISLQNPHDTTITGNSIHHAVRQDDAVINPAGYTLSSGGVVVWVHPDQTVDNLRIERNHLNDLGIGIAVGASPFHRLNNVIIASNIVNDNDVGIHLNSGDINGMSGAYFNTLVNNHISLRLNSGGQDYNIFNNISVNPTEYHVYIAEVHGFTSQFDYNLYVPDGPLFFFDNLATPYADIDEWRDAINAMTGLVGEANSLTANNTGFVSTSPINPADFQLTNKSPARDSGIDIFDVSEDFSGGSRSKGRAPNIGAWEN